MQVINDQANHVYRCDRAQLDAGQLEAVLEHALDCQLPDSFLDSLPLLAHLLAPFVVQEIGFLTVRDNVQIISFDLFLFLAMGHECIKPSHRPFWVESTFGPSIPKAHVLSTKFLELVSSVMSHPALLFRPRASAFNILMIGKYYFGLILIIVQGDRFGWPAWALRLFFSVKLVVILVLRGLNLSSTTFVISSIVSADFTLSVRWFMSIHRYCNTALRFVLVNSLNFNLEFHFIVLGTVAVSLVLRSTCVWLAGVCYVPPPIVCLFARRLVWIRIH